MRVSDIGGLGVGGWWRCSYWHKACNHYNCKRMKNPFGIETLSFIFMNVLPLVKIQITWDSPF